MVIDRYHHARVAIYRNYPPDMKPRRDSRPGIMGFALGRWGHPFNRGPTGCLAVTDILGQPA